MSSFKPNPLSLSVPDPALDRWLRDSGYLNLLDSSASTPTTASSSAAAPANPASASAAAAADVLAIARTLASVLALNPFARLSAADLAAPTPPWSLAFLGPPGAASYSWPPTPTQARLRVQENVRRYARNYAALAIVVFACCLCASPSPLSLPLLIVADAFTALFQPLRLRSKSATATAGVCVQVPDANGVIGDVSHTRGVGGCEVLPGALGTCLAGTQGWAVSPTLCADRDDVACLFSKIDSSKPT
ncbi:PRA1 family protein H isoform X2 [Oryza brachyantha]|uniref:PRA1 family protein H isoform X2 n=1 Tax=Oryza brachyantha TaxID=4533 RepID=UPI001AD9AD1D|nr:PRA1 family protein H isoform X2 [Oryza brachyantha]